MTYKRMLISLIFPLTLISYSYGQAGATSQLQGNDSSDSTVRRIDFLNFTYFPNLCNQEYAKEGIGNEVRVHKGEFKNDEIYYGVVDDKVIYVDLTNDSSEEALVHISCGDLSANFGLSEIFVFTLKGKEAVLLGALNENDLKPDYQHSYPGGTLWSIIYKGVNVVGGELVVEVAAEGPHCCPKFIVTLRYRWNGTSLVRVGKIERRKFK